MDWRVTIHELCSELDMGYGTVHRILKDELNMSRVSACWVPQLLKNHEMEGRVMDSKTFLRWFENEGDAFLNGIITTDETWLFYYDPETKQQSSQWKSSNSHPPKEGKNVQVHGKTHVNDVLRHKRSNFESCRTKRTVSQFHVLFKGSSLLSHGSIS